jgi:nicotinamidase/pyrazinamidase
VARALIIVDVQNDFARADGALAVPRGEEVIDPINALAASGAYDLVVATRDWHPPDHASFQTRGGIWPEHCVRDTPGAQLHERLRRSAIGAVIDKGTDAAAPGYSGFESTGLRELLEAQGADDLTITGLATEYCVKHTALDALELGLAVTIPREAVRGIDDADSARALADLEQAGATVAADQTSSATVRHGP